MSSQLNVDTIVDKAGSGGTNVKIANTSTYVSDGGAVTQNTVQGLAKTWFLYDQDDDTIDDSFSISSITDTSTGVFTSTFANNFSAKPCPVGMCSYFSFCNTRNFGGDAITTSDTDFNISNSGASQVDRNEISISFNGDLA